MVRVRSNVAKRRRTRKFLKRAKGFVGARSRLYRSARETTERAEAYAYRDRKVRRRELRALWIQRINAACRRAGLNYSRFMAGLSRAKVALSRKELADLAVRDETGFLELVKIAQAAGAVNS